MQTLTSTNLVLLIAALTVGALFGCDQWESSPGIDDDIASFVKSEPLPDAQRPRVVVASDSLNARVFWVSFGEARDCPSGCFFSKAYGLSFRGRIGWMGLDAYGRDDSVKTQVTYFDVHPGDSTLFTEDLRERFQRAGETAERSYTDAAFDQFLEMLARDEETPHETLMDLARLLRDQYRPATGLALLENPEVRSSKSILEVLAGLPDRGGYQTVRDRARALLDQL